MPRQKRETSRDGAGRQKRVPLGQTRQKMAVEPNKGKTGRWINDWPGRIEAAQAAGYDFVPDTSKTDSEGRAPHRQMRVGVKEDGTPLIAYYMEIPDKFYREDQKAKQKEVDKIDDAIRRGNVHGAVGQDGRYIPSQGINVKSRTE